MKDEIKEKIKAYYVANDIDEIICYITNLQERLEVSQTNEETYRLEIKDITKCLGLDEDTIFDEVKEKATNLQEKIEYNDLVLKALHRYLTEHECYETHEFLRQLESCTENDMLWLKRMAGVSNE